MTIRIGINGFGRIGRMVFRAAVKSCPDIEIVGINDLLEPDYLAYMLKYDSVQGRFDADVRAEGNTLIVNGKKIRLSAEKDRPVPDPGSRAKAPGRRRRQSHDVRPFQRRHAHVRLRRQ